jgi:methylglutaconyl-CoA hydratase
MAYSMILQSVLNRVTTITLNRPEKRNALNAEMVRELQEAFDNAGHDVDTKIIHFRANGPAFSAGADIEYLQQLQRNSYEENLADSRALMRLFHTIYKCPKPVIAIVNGPAIAGGCGLVTVCDFVIAVDNAQFGYSEVKIGFVPSLVMIFLVKRVGEAMARRMLLTGERLSASKAERIGLVGQAVSAGRVEKEVDALTEALLAEASPQSLKRIKFMFDKLTGLTLEDALDFAAVQNAEARSTEDFRNGIDSFLKRVKVTW